MSKHNHTSVPVRLIPIAVILVIAIIAAAKNCGSDRTTTHPASATAANASPGEFDTLALALPYTTDSIPSAVKQYEGYTLSFNPRRHTPNWVAYVLTSSHLEGTQKRTNKFWQDPDIPGCPDPKQYSLSGYDRGHMIPAADQKWSATAMHHSFSMANIAPQDRGLNTNAWQSLEKMVRREARKDTAVIVITGPVYIPSDTTHLPSTQILIPSAFFKIIAKPWGTEPWAKAYIYPNSDVKSQPSAFAVTVRQIEDVTGLDFFHTLPTDLQHTLETTINK